MKTLKKILLLTFIISFAGCNDWLDLRPESETVLEDYWQSESQATQVLASCYKKLTSDECMSRIMLWGEIRSDNMVSNLSSITSVSKILAGNITPTNEFADWGSFYTAINYCNTFLHFAPGVVNKDQKFTLNKLHTLEAEAKALRALCYFYLVRTFRDVPLVTEPSISDDQDYFIGQSPEHEVLDTIISDLKFAQKYIRSDYGKGEYNKGRITLNAVNAILADVYLWDQQYANCVDACNLVLQDNTLALVSGDKVLNQVFYKGNSTESIFELQFDKDVQNNNEVNTMYGTESIFGVLSYAYFLVRGKDLCPFDYTVSATKESENDIREYSSYSSLTSEGLYKIYKYQLVDITANSDGITYTPKYRSTATTVNWIMYRLSDVMLMKAEALVELYRGTTDRQEVIDLVNTTYLRSNPTADPLQLINYNDQGSLEKLVLRERQRELLFEGKRWFDLMRLVRRKNNASLMLSYIAPKLMGDGISLNKLSVMDALYMPVSKSQIDINPKLTQNPFYTDENLSN